MASIQKSWQKQLKHNRMSPHEIKIDLFTLLAHIASLAPGFTDKV